MKRITTTFSIALLFAACGRRQEGARSKPSEPTPNPESRAELVARVQRSVVAVKTSDGAGKTGSATAFRMGPGGAFVTNFHVIDGYRNATLVVNAQRSCPVTGAAAHDKDEDWAVLLAPACGDLPALERGDSDRVSAGDPVLAVGNPLEMAASASFGAITAIRGRLLQHDAVTAPGSSGSPLVDARGRAVGVHRAAVGPGIGLAVAIRSIPSEVAASRSVPVARFARAPAISAARLVEIAQADASNLRQLIRGFQLYERGIHDFPRNPRGAYLAEIGGKQCPESPALPGLVVALLGAENALAEAVAGNLETRRRFGRIGVEVAKGRADGPGLAGWNLVRQIGATLGAMADAFDAVAEAEQAVARLCRRPVVTDEYPDLAANWRWAGKQMAQIGEFQRGREESP